MTNWIRLHTEPLALCPYPIAGQDLSRDFHTRDEHILYPI